MATKTKILFAQKHYDINSTLKYFSPFLSCYLHEMLHLFINCLMNLKSQCQLIPIYQSILCDF